MIRYLMKHLRKFSLLESDQTLSTEQIAFLNKHVQGSWSINPETGLVDVDGHFHCNNLELKSFHGIRFGEVTGDFYCNDNQLVTLEGGPEKVGGDFSCSRNQLVSLEGAPEKIDKDFYCNRNQLVTLEGGPKKIAGNFYCGRNQLVTLEGAPEKVGGDFYCHSNRLVSLEGAPKECGGDFYCQGNPVSEESLLAIWEFMKEGNEYSTALLLAFSQITKPEDKKLLFKGMDLMNLFKKELANRTFAPYLAILKDLNISISQFSNEEIELINKLSKGYQILQRK